MANSGQIFRRIFSSRVVPGTNKMKHDSGLREYPAGSSEQLSAIITSSKASISQLQQELKSAIASLDLIYTGASPVVNPGSQRHETNISQTPDIVFHSSSVSSTKYQDSPEFDLSEISITPVSQGSATFDDELEEILITPI